MVTAEAKIEKRSAILRMQSGRRLMRLSRAKVLFIPAMWLRLYGWEVDGHTWVKVEQDGANLIISPIDQDEAKAMMEANDVRIS